MDQNVKQCIDFAVYFYQIRWFDIIAFVCKAPKVHEVVKLTASCPRLFACIYYNLYMQQIRAVMDQNVKQGVDFAMYFLLNTVVWHLQILLFFIVSHRDALQYDTFFSFTSSSCL